MKDSHWGRGIWLCLGIGLLASLSLIAPAGASADSNVCAPGSGGGQCDEPSGIAADTSTGNVYIADTANNRINVFSASGSFLFTFGWGVADGTAEAQTCEEDCFKGLAGGGAGEFDRPQFITVDPASHDIFVFEQFRVQRFTSLGEFVSAWGGGVINGGANGTGTLAAGSTTISNVVTQKKAFSAGQTISGAGVPPETTIASVGPGAITLSKAATASGATVALSVAEGVGNIPINEIQVLPSINALSRGVAFTTPDPSPSVATLPRPFPIAEDAPASGPGSLQEMLESLSNINTGDIAVSGPNGGPYTIEFKGRYEDTDVSSLQDLSSNGMPTDSGAIQTLQNGGGSAEICTQDRDCSGGVKGLGASQFGSRSEPIVVGVDGSVFVGDTSGSSGAFKSRIEKFQSSGTLLKEIALPESQSLGELAVDSLERFYVTRGGKAGFEVYNSSGVLETSLALDNVSALTIDPSSDRLLASHREGQLFVISEVDGSGSVVSRFGYESLQQSPAGIAAAHTATGDVLASEPSSDRIRYLKFPPKGPLPCCLEVNAGNTKATLKGQVNPEGKSTIYHFEYLTDAEYVANGNSFSGPDTPISTPVSAPVGSDFSLHAAQAAIGCTAPTDPPQPECLEPETKYHARLVATNADDEGEENASAEIVFETKERFEFGDIWSTDVGLNDAEIHAEVNPLGIPATTFFEYVDDASFQASEWANATKAPTTPIDLGGGEAFVTADAKLAGLTENTIYHYRAVASDAFIDEEAGPEGTFTTFSSPTLPLQGCANDVFRIGFSATLPDCRAYEMVSPIDKNGGDIKVLVQGVSFPARLDQSADSGDAFTYSSVAAFAEPQSSLWSSQYLARRGVESWSTEPINQPKEPTNLTDNPVLKLDVQYRHFSPDLANGWASQYASPPLDQCAPEGFINLYRRDNTSGTYQALVTNPPAGAITDYRIELQGLSADESHAVFRANAKLTTDASSVSGANAYQLYLHVADPEGGCGQLRLVSFKPNGAAGAPPASVGSPAGPAEYRASTLARAVSADGSRVFFTTGSTPTNSGPLFVRVNADQPQGAVSGGKCSFPITAGCTLEITSTSTQYWTADTKGSRVIYSVGSELFEYDVDKAIKNEAAKTLIASGAQGVVGASEDASRIYFVSTNQIEGEGEAGKPNLYLYEPAKAAPDKYRLVAMLSAKDAGAFLLQGFGVGNAQPIRNGTRLSADGSHLAFVSQASLTGYDNIDANSGEPAIELYLYDTASEEVRCVSCNPSGSRPEARKFLEGEEGEAGAAIRYVSAMMAPGESQTFAPRSLSADGNRLFFESFESLLPRDINKTEDVYEWQRAANAAACQALGMELFVPAAGGCLSLISSGQDETDSELADASPDGSDVFIRTASSLLPQDPGQVDVYDVREGGGLPIPPLPQTPCEGEECSGSVPTPPADTGIASQGPSSGNVIPPKSCPKGKTRNKAGKCVKKKPNKKKSKGQKKQASNNKKGAKR